MVVNGVFVWVGVGVCDAVIDGVLVFEGVVVIVWVFVFVGVNVAVTEGVNDTVCDGVIVFVIVLLIVTVWDGV